MTAEKRFEKKVAAYKAMGVRMVCFDHSDEHEEMCGCSWIMAFNTHGVNAEEIPLERFANHKMRRWMKSYGYDSIEQLTRFDLTDDIQEMLDCYDYEGKFIVQQLV